LQLKKDAFYDSFLELSHFFQLIFAQIIINS
jgi:hypothetical protein